MDKKLADKITDFVANEIISPVFDSDKELWEKLASDTFNKLIEIVYSEVEQN